LKHSWTASFGHRSVRATLVLTIRSADGSKTLRKAVVLRR